MFHPEEPTSPEEKSSNPQDQIKSEKEINWQSKLAEVEGIKDALGRGLDNHIKEAVVALNLLGVHTSASCEGHIDHGRPSPWIEIEAPNKPEERFVNQKSIFQKMAQKYGIPYEHVKR